MDADCISETDGSEDECENTKQRLFWNNWKPKRFKSENLHKINPSLRISYTSKECSKNNSFKKHAKVWIPPETSRENIVAGVENLLKKEEGCKKIVNVQRTELHDMTKKTDGEVMFGMIEADILDKIKLGKDSSGHVSCWATGEIMKVGSSEKSLICVTNEDHLREILQVSLPQWSALVDCLHPGTQLNFSSSQKMDMRTTCSLDKLWYLLCKRRHYLPMLLVQVQLCGQIKLNNFYNVLPRLNVISASSIVNINLSITK